ncbi:lysozyme inhibitor LprI family protein [Ruegeria arenilitoris]|uniref:lysozyme inhibitor LprI family protein n=1 Tax=Ruegeria arenilitoris TaxID=1173585 RepID=UPI00147AFCC3|nr:lysozyme inhibitor LprI family protein [Ruegeria arenilitoris]
MRHALLLLLLPSAALADPTLECTNAGSQVEIGSCVSAMEDRVALALEESYGFALQAAAELDDVTGRNVAQPALEAAQSAWESYRDAQCEAIGASYGGGSGTGIAITSCRVDLGRARVDELLRFAD